MGDNSGNSYCGQKYYRILENPNWVTITPTSDGADIQASAVDLSDVWKTFDFTLEVSMVDYPSAPKVTQTFQVKVGAACENGQFYIDNPSMILSNTNKNFSVEIGQSDLNFLNLDFYHICTVDFFRQICIPQISFWQQKDGGAKENLDPNIFTVTPDSYKTFQFSTQPPFDTSIAGTYVIGADLWTLGYESQTLTEAPDIFTVEITYNPCPTANIAFAMTTNPFPSDIYYRGDLIDNAATGNTLHLSDYFTTDQPTLCPLSYSCSVKNVDTGLVYPDCDFQESTHTSVSLDPVTGVFAFHSTDFRNTKYPPGSYEFTWKAHSGSSSKFEESKTSLTLNCMVLKEDVSWNNGNEFVESTFNRKDYLGLTWTQALADQLGVQWQIQYPEPFYDQTPGTCPLIVDLQTGLTLSGSISEALDPQGLVYDTHYKGFSSDWQQWFAPALDIPHGHSQRVTFYWLFQNLQVDNQSDFDPSYLTYIRQKNYISGYELLQLDSFVQTPNTIDLASESTTASFNLPAFIDIHSLSTSLDKTNDPDSTIYFKIVDHETEMISQYFNYEVLSQTKGVKKEVSFSRGDLTSPLDSFDLIACFNYGTGEFGNLQDVCDTENIHRVSNARSICADELPNQLLQEPVHEKITVILGQDQFEVLDLASKTIDQSQQLSSLCSPFSFSTEKYEQEGVLVETNPDGKVSILKIEDPNLIGTHEVTFTVSTSEISLGQISSVKMQNVALTIEIIAKQVVVDNSPSSEAYIAQIAGSLIRKAPKSVESLKPSYVAFYGMYQSFTFEFVNPLALKELEEDDPEYLSFSGLKIKVHDNEMPSVILIEKTSYDKGLGHASLTFNVDGLAALELFEKGIGLEEDQGIEGVTKTVFVDVKDLSPGGHTSTFELKFIFEQRKFEEIDLHDDKLKDSQDEAEIMAASVQAQQSAQYVIMKGLLEAAFQHQVEQIAGEDILIEASLKAIDQVGYTYIAFDPPVVAVPNDWDRLWDLAEREKMALSDRKAFEEELLEIMHVQFVQNNEENPQKYFYPELLDFDERGIKIHLNFSDPLLVSQGEIADQIQIKLLKDYFMQPSPILVKLQGRSLATIEEDEKYITIIEEIPSQLQSLSDQITLQQAANTVKDILYSGFTLTFFMNLGLNGLMSQLWNTFNTMQIILALPLLTVLLPSNMIFILELVDQVVNFSVIKNDMVQENIVTPLFGEEEEDEPEVIIDDEGKDKTVKNDDEEKPSLIAQTFQIVSILIILIILVGLLVFCQRKILPRCCPCFKKVITLIKAKIMFNSVLRALIQTYLMTCISSWSALLDSDRDTSLGIVDTIQAVILLIGFASYPIWIFRFLKKNLHQLRNPAFKMKYDSAYQNVEYYKPDALYHTSLFLVRRILFAFVVAFCYHSIVLQVVIADALSTALLAYFFSVFPMNDGINNAIQIINEIVVLTSTWLMFWFTLYVDEPQTRYELAWKFIYFIGFNFGLNICILIWTILKKIYIAVKIAYLKRQTKNAIAQRIGQEASSNTKTMVPSQPDNQENFEMRARRRAQLRMFVDPVAQNRNILLSGAERQQEESDSSPSASSVSVSKDLSVSKSNNSQSIHRQSDYSLNVDSSESVSVHSSYAASKSEIAEDEDEHIQGASSQLQNQMQSKHPKVGQQQIKQNTRQKLVIAESSERNEEPKTNVEDQLTEIFQREEQRIILKRQENQEKIKQSLQATRSRENEELKKGECIVGNGQVEREGRQKVECGLSFYEKIYPGIFTTDPKVARSSNVADIKSYLNIDRMIQDNFQPDNVPEENKKVVIQPGKKGSETKPNEIQEMSFSKESSLVISSDSSEMDSSQTVSSDDVPSSKQSSSEQQSSSSGSSSSQSSRSLSSSEFSQSQKKR